MITSHIKDLIPDPRNARKHSPRNVGMIEDALREVGAARSIVIDENNTVLAGNATIEAAANAGIEKVQIVETDGETIVAVKRSGLTKKQKARLALFDNRTAELADGWDSQVLFELQSDGIDLDGLWSDKELEEVLGDLFTPKQGNGGDDFDTTPDESQTRVKFGELWECLGHRILCGDSTRADHVERLMAGELAGVILTDPPYAVDYVAKARDMNSRGYGHSRATLSAAIEGDGIESGQEEDLWRDAFTLATSAALTEHAAWYVWHAAGRAGTVLYNLLAEIGILHHQTIIWVKNNFVIGRCDYQWKHEPCFYGWVKGNRPPFYGERNQTTVWDISRDTVSPDHPTQKPVDLFIAPIKNHLKPNEIIYDPFMGSGTSMIAAHRAGCRAFGLEIKPAYADLILRRIEAEIGQEATRLS